MARSSTPVAYNRQALPLISGGDLSWTSRELQRIEAAILSTQRLTPQPATEAPKTAVDGMIRLARQPWQPLSGRLGITHDCWVYYDGAGKIWRHIGEDPTNT